MRCVKCNNAVFKGHDDGNICMCCGAYVLKPLDEKMAYDRKADKHAGRLCLGDPRQISSQVKNMITTFYDRIITMKAEGVSWPAVNNYLEQETGIKTCDNTLRKNFMFVRDNRNV